MGVWRRRGKAASAGLSAALYSVYHGLYSEAVVSSVASAVALAEAGQFKEAVQYLQKAAKALYEAARDVFEHVKVTAQRLVELFVETFARALALIHEHRAYLFLMAAAAAGAVALNIAFNMWGLIELEKLAHAAVGAPFFAGRTDTGGRAAERFKTLAERHERWRVDENVINEIINAPLNKERPYKTLLRLAEQANLPKPFVELRKALASRDEVVQDAAVVAALVLYKTLVKNAEAYREWAEWYKWARGLVEKQEFTVATSDIKRLREAQRRLEEAAEEVRRELNSVLALYASHSRDLYEKLRPHLEVDVKKAEGLAEARSDELRRHSNTNMGTKAYAALLSAARGGAYGHAAILLMMEGALANMVLLTPKSAYEKAKGIAEERGEAVDPSYSSRRGRSAGKPRWEDRAASALLRYLLSRAVNENLVFRRVKEGFKVFRTYGGVEVGVDVLRIWETVASSKAGEEVLRRFVEEAKETAPDLSGIKKIWQTLEWLNTDVTFNKEWIVAGTAHTWQAAWYVGLFGEPKPISGRASITEKGVRPNVTMRWRREVLDSIIAEEGEELEPLLGRTVKSWRELVDAINWSQVLKKVEELVDKLKPWIGSEGANEAERGELARRMLDELALLAYFAEARRGMDDDKWREGRIKRLAEAAEDLSGGRIAGEHAERLAMLIIRYAEGYKKYAEGLIESLAKAVGVSTEEMRGVVKRVLSGEGPYVYCLAKDCADDKIIRKFVAPALKLIMLDKALRGEFNRERAKLIFGEMYATALAGDGTVGPDEVKLTVGGELGGGAALLRLVTLHLLNQLLPDELKFDARIYVEKDRYYRIATYGENAARFKRFLAVTAPSAGGEYLSEKFKKFVEAAQVKVRLDKSSIRLTRKGYVAAYLIISEAGVTVKYNVYLQKEVVLQFASSNHSRVELAVQLLKLAGVNAEAKKEGGRDVWRVVATTDTLAAGSVELRNAIAEIVETARVNGWVDADKAKLWLNKLKRGRASAEGWPKYRVGLTEGALVVRFSSTNPDSIERQAQRLREMGLVEGVHFSVRMPEGGKVGYVNILREGLAYAAWLSVYSSGRQQELTAEFVNYILQRAEKAGKEVYKKASEIIEEGKTRGSLKLEGFKKEVEVDGRKHMVKVIGGGAEVEEGEGGKLLLRIRITAEVDGVLRDYTITYSRYGDDNETMGRAFASAKTPGGRLADAERFSALIKALTGREPKVYQRSDGAIIIYCGREHLDGFKRYAELADAIKRWLEETSR